MKKILIGMVLINIFLGGFAQAPSGVEIIRDYVGLISAADHPDFIAFVEKVKEDLQKDTDIEDNGEQDKPLPKEPPYERPAGSGFLIKADDGNTYILTNWHVISFSWDYSITFEKSMDQKTVYSGLTLLAADEDIDLALLAFAPDNKPDREGLSLMERPVREGEEVFSAGFPALGRDPVWQLGRGQISNSRVMLHKYYDDEEDETMEGPFIQHTSQVDPGNSGGPLLIADASSFSGFTVAGVNAKSARRRQAANYSIPCEAVRIFLENVLDPSLQDTETERKKLDERLSVFTKGLKADRISIYDWITYQCFLDNVEYAYYHYSIKNSYSRYYANSPMYRLMSAFNAFVRDTIPSSVIKKKNEITILSIEEEKEGYRIIIEIRGKELSSFWEKEHGVWRISSIGKIDGDKTKIAKAEKQYNNQKNIRSGSNYFDNYTVEGGYALVLNRGGAVYGALGLSSIGLRCIFADRDYWQLELFGRAYTKPLRFSVFAMEMNYGLGMGIKCIPKVNGNDSGLRFGISPQIGTQFTSSIIPGLYIGAAYQYNLYFRNSDDENNTRHLFIFMAGYRFKE